MDEMFLIRSLLLENEVDLVLFMKEGSNTS